MIVKCDYCGKEIEKPTNYVNQNRKRGHKIFCSSKCRSLAGKVVCYCANCGKQILKTPAEIKNSKTGNVFCNKSCACSYNNSHFRKGENNPNWIDGTHVGSAYIRTAYRTYVHKCAICNLDEECCLEVHHIDENRDNDNPDNLIILCANCHSRIHRGGLKITEEVKNKREIIRK